MKIQIDGKTIFELNDTKKKVIQNDIPSEVFQEDMERRAQWVVEHKYEQCFKRLKEEWEPKLKGKVESFPADDDKFAELIFSQPEYKSRSQKIREEKEQEHLKRTGQI